MQSQFTPQESQTIKPQKNRLGSAVVSMILGIISTIFFLLSILTVVVFSNTIFGTGHLDLILFCFSAPCALLGFPLGIWARKSAPGRGMAIAGMTLTFIPFMLSLILLIGAMTFNFRFGLQNELLSTGERKELAETEEIETSDQNSVESPVITDDTEVLSGPSKEVDSEVEEYPSTESNNGSSEKSTYALSSEKLYRVQAGVFSIEENALALESNIKEQGIETGIVKKDGLYVVYVGAFRVKENADNRLTELQSYGFKGLIKYE